MARPLATHMDETAINRRVNAANECQWKIPTDENGNSSPGGGAAPPMDVKPRVSMPSSCCIQGLLDIPLTVSVLCIDVDFLGANDVQPELTPDLEQLMRLLEGANGSPSYAPHIVRCDPEARGKATSGEAGPTSPPRHS